MSHSRIYIQHSMFQTRILPIKTVNHFLAGFIFKVRQSLVENLQIRPVLHQELAVEVEHGNVVSVILIPLLVFWQRYVNCLQLKLKPNQRHCQNRSTQIIHQAIAVLSQTYVKRHPHAKVRSNRRFKNSNKLLFSILLFATNCCNLYELFGGKLWIIYIGCSIGLSL